MANQTAGVAEPNRSRLARNAVFALRGSPEYRAWLAGLTEESLIATSKIARDALAMWAQSRGFPPPPKM
jgi:hypothetical protein